MLLKKTTVTLYKLRWFLLAGLILALLAADTRAEDHLNLAGTVKNPQGKGIKDVAVKVTVNGQPLQSLGKEGDIRTGARGSFAAEFTLPAGTLPGAEVKVQASKPAWRASGPIQAKLLAGEVDGAGNHLFYTHQNLGLERQVTPAFWLATLILLLVYQGVWGGIATTGSNAGSEIPAQGGSTQRPSTIYGGFMPQDDLFKKPKIAYIQFDVEHCLSFILFNDDMLEDSIIPWLPFIRNELSKNVSPAIDDAVYNGDASTNQDGHTDTFHIRNACHGLRWMCGATADGWIDTGTPYNATPRDCNVIVVNGTLALSNIDQAIRQMGKYALQPAKCVYAVRVPDYLRLMQLDVFRLYTNAGPQQTLHNGVMGQIYGIDVVPTDIIPLFNEYGCLTAGAGADWGHGRQSRPGRARRPLHGRRNRGRTGGLSRSD